MLPVVPTFAGVLDARTSGPLASRAVIAQPLAVGLSYFATDTGEFYVYDGSVWVRYVRAAELEALEARVAALE